MKQWLRRLVAALGSIMLLAAMMLGLLSSPAAASSSVSFNLNASDPCSDTASASGTITEYFDGFYYNVNFSGSDTGNWVSMSLDVGSTTITGDVFSPYGSATATGFYQAAGLSGGLVLTMDGEGCTGSNNGYGPSVSTLSSPGSISLTSYSGMPYNQVQVALNSNVYNNGNAASWTITQQQLNSSGGVIATNTYSLSTPPAGSATWTSSNQQPGYAYQYTASVVVNGTSYSTNSELFPVAGTPTVGSITSTSAVVSWPAVDGGSPYTFGWWYTNGGAWPGTTSSVSGTSDTLTGLSPNNDYTVGIAASTPDGGPGWAQGSAAFWTLANPPAGVSLSFSGSTATVSWGANSNPNWTTYQAVVTNSSSGAWVTSAATTTGTSYSFAGICGGSFDGWVQAENGAGQWTAWQGVGPVAGPPCLSLSISGPSGYPPSNPYQLNVTVASVMASAGTATITQQQLSPAGSVVATNTFSVSVGADSSGTTTVTNQQYGGPGYVYRYTATMNGQTSNSALFANAPTFYVHRRARGLFIAWPDEGNGAQYEVFGGPVGTGCGGGSGSFNSGMLPAGTTQWAIGGLTPNTEYAMCMWAEIPGQPVTSGGWLPTWWSSGGNPNSSGMWYTLPDAPGQLTPGGLLAAYYNVPSLAGNQGPSEQVFGNNATYTAVQGPIDFAISCNCTSSWPYAGHGGPMPPNTAGGGTAQFFAAKYLGWVYAPTTGTYTFGCKADDACQVWIDGMGLVASGMTSGGSSPNYYGVCNACGGVAGTVSLTAGTWYAIEVDYTQVGGGAGISLYWTPPGGQQGDIPASDLAYPSLSGAAGGGQWQATISWPQQSNPGGASNPPNTNYAVQQFLLSPSGSVTSSGTLCQTTGDSCTTSNLGQGTVSGYYADAESGDGFWTPSTTEPGGGGYLWADAPQPSVATPTNSGSLSVNWPALGNGAHFGVVWNTQNSGSGASMSSDLGTGQTSYTIGGLQPDTQYYVWIDAWIPEPSGVGDNACANGSGGGCYWSGAAPFPQWTLANPPTSLVVTGASNSLSGSWSPNGNPNTTNYSWSVTPAGSSSTSLTGTTGTQAATASPLVCQSNYSFAVWAVNGANVPTTQTAVTSETGTCSPPPKVALEVDNGLSQTASTSVTLDIQATDANYAQSQLKMRFSNDGSAWSTWQSYAATATWTLTGAPGPNTVYAEVQDPQDGLGSAIATISYDSSLSTVTSGSGTACAYEGTSATCTNNPIVTATFTVPSGAVSMETSLDGENWSQPRDAKASVSLVLPTGDGLKAVFARYFNQDNVATPEGPDYFVLDTTPPAIQSVSWLNNAAATDAGAATLVIQASDNITPASALQVSISGAATWSGVLPSNEQIPLTLTGTGYVTVDVKVSDQAGNTATAQAGIYN